ncbi:hypothetical protein EIN_002310 [Entamoeba invadens IP1]|uniref:Uncharacterized protein n=1 Tax=Entamoeba invadens IP1 TaxID=370355 RepID=L7FJ85_ENTIV|nr:hypothetical protein EIN_002310 [Entamoeba invadens IP1]ELP83570.1 hypothetical protein EIN_002310 [Entamoeba invadens IP1]|eukprot:XP_004182916.1 hypothetical protein EIN_002310 [Entamoeba invadens IP1]
MFSLLLLFISLSVSTTVVLNKQTSYFVAYVPDTCYFRNNFQAAQKVVKKQGETKYTLQYAVSCDVSSWSDDINASLEETDDAFLVGYYVKYNFYKDNDCTTKSPGYYITSLGCVSFTGHNITINSDNKKVYMTYYADSKCSTSIDGKSNIEKNFGVCDNSMSPVNQFTAPNFYIQEDSTSFQVYVEGICYLDDDNNFVVVENDGYVYAGNSCQEALASTTKLETKTVHKVTSFPEYFFREVSSGSNDCNIISNLALTTYPDNYYKKEGYCMSNSASSGFIFITTKNELTHFYYTDAACNKLDKNYTYQYKTCVLDNNKQY